MMLFRLAVASMLLAGCASHVKSDLPKVVKAVDHSSHGAQLERATLEECVADRAKLMRVPTTLTLLMVARPENQPMLERLKRRYPQISIRVVDELDTGSGGTVGAAGRKADRYFAVQSIEWVSHHMAKVYVTDEDGNFAWLDAKLQNGKWQIQPFTWVVS